MKILDIPQDGPEWDLFRRSHFTATDTRKLFGICPWKGTPYKVWAHKVLGEKEEVFNPNAERGKRIESQARCWVELERQIKCPPVCVESSEHPWIGASLDGLDEENEQVIEIKANNPKTHAEAKEGIIPDYYMTQLQTQLLATGYKKALYVSYDGLQGHIITVFRDEEMIERIIKESKKFWETYVDGLKAPTFSDKDYEKDEDPEDEKLINEYAYWCEMARQAEYQKKSIASYFEKRANGRVRVQFGKLRYTQYLRQGNIDYSMIPELEGVNLEKYRKPPIVQTKLTIQGKE